MRYGTLTRLRGAAVEPFRCLRPLLAWGDQASPGRPYRLRDDRGCVTISRGEGFAIGAIPVIQYFVLHKQAFGSVCALLNIFGCLRGLFMGSHNRRCWSK